jgi:hypothetical protein
VKKPSVRVCGRAYARRGARNSDEPEDRATHSRWGCFQNFTQSKWLRDRDAGLLVLARLVLPLFQILVSVALRRVLGRGSVRALMPSLCAPRPILTLLQRQCRQSPQVRPK